MAKFPGMKRQDTAACKNLFFLLHFLRKKRFDGRLSLKMQWNQKILRFSVFRRWRHRKFCTRWALNILGLFGPEGWGRSQFSLLRDLIAGSSSANDLVTTWLRDNSLAFKLWIVGSKSSIIADILLIYKLFKEKNSSFESASPKDSVQFLINKLLMFRYPYK